MSSVESKLAAASRNRAVRPESESCAEPFTVHPESEFCERFAAAARDLLGSDTGLGLHVLTGVSESSGYRYASGERPATGDVVFRLLRGPHGAQWLAALMHGCTAQWWTSHERTVRLAAAAQRFKQEVASI